MSLTVYPPALGAGQIALGTTGAPMAAGLLNAMVTPNYLPLRRFHAALANVGAAAVDVCCIGDSVTEGGNATDRATRWVARLRDGLRGLYQPAGVTGGEGYVPLRYYHSSLTNLFTLTGTFGTWGLFGLGGNRNVKIGTGFVTQASATVPAATRIHVLYGLGPSVGSFNVSVDGGAAATVNGASGPTVDTGMWDSGALTAGAHTVTITPASGLSAVDGIMVYNGDETAGIRLWEAGHSGYKSGDALSGPQWFTALATVQPALVTICYGLNDYSGNIAPSTFGANLAAIIAQVRANVTVPPSIVLLVPLGRADVTNPAYPWSAYVSQIYATAAADGDVAVLDLAQRGGTQAQARALNILDTDNVHLSPTQGGQWWANALLRAVTP